MTKGRDASEVDRHYLAVPYGERGSARAAGARWDRDARSWYLPEGEDLSRVQRWRTEEGAAELASAEFTSVSDPRQEFVRVLLDMGAKVTGRHPMMDGRRHRIAVEGDRGSERAGSYVGYLDGVVPAGHMLNFRTGLNIKWKASGGRLDEASWSRLRAELAQARHRREVARSARQRAVAGWVRERLSELAPVRVPTPYLVDKGIGVHPGVFTDGAGATIIPAMDFAGVWTLQTIGTSGEKRFTRHGRKSGCFHVIGGLDGLPGARALVVAEGYATAATLAELLGQPVVAGFDGGNLVAVAKALRAHYPQKPIVVVGDDDLAGELNPRIARNSGEVHARDAANAVGGHLVLPVFAPGEQGRDPRRFSDFNDLATRSALGRDAAQRQIRQAVGQAIGLHGRSHRPALGLKRERSARRGRGR